MKKVLLASLVVASLSSGYASADVSVGGVEWDPNFVLGPEMDFISRFNFTQWFSNTSDTVGNVDSYSTAVTFQDVVNATSPAGVGAATGLFLSGVGEWNEVNGKQTSIGSVTGGAATSFCPGCEVTYSFGGLGLNDDLTFDLTDAWAQVFVDTSPDFNVPPASQADANEALGDLLWLDLEFTAVDFTSLGGGASSGFVDATLAIVGGAAADKFVPQTLEYNGSAFNAGLSTQYSTGGNGSIQGNTIPEPATLAMFGLGLLGLGSFARRRRS